MKRSFGWEGEWRWSRSIAGERYMKFGNFVSDEVSEALIEGRFTMK